MSLEQPLNSENLAPVPTGGLVPLVVDGAGVMHWSAFISGLSVPTHTHDGSAGSGGQLVGEDALNPTTGFGATVLDSEPWIDSPRIAQINSQAGTGQSAVILISSATVSDDNHIVVESAPSGSSPKIIAESGAGDPNVSLDIQTFGTGTLQQNGVPVGLTGNPLSQFAATTSAQLRGVLSDETGTGAAVFADTPTLVTPTIADFTNATHDHTTAARGGQLTQAALSDATSTPTASSIPIALGTGKLAAGWLSEVLALADLSDVTAKTGTGTVVVMQGSPVLTTPSIGDFTNATHTHADNAGGGKLNVATALGAGSPGHTLKSGASAPAWTAAGILFRREWQFLADPAGTTGTRVGLLTAPTLSGTVSNVDGTTRPLIRHVTGAVSGNSAGVLSGIDVTRSGWLAKTALVVSVGNTITSYRLWAGHTSADLTGVATPTTQHVAAFSYDTGRDGTVFWRTVTCDGATATVTATSVAFAASTTYNLRIEMNGATNVLFYIDDVLVATHTTNLPATTVILGFQISVTTLTNATRRLEWSRVGGEAI